MRTTLIGLGLVVTLAACAPSPQGSVEHRGFQRVGFRAVDDSRWATDASFLTCAPEQTSVIDKGVARCAYRCASDRECPGAFCERAVAAAGETTVCSAAPTTDRISVFGAPPLTDGSCPSSFAAAPSVGSMCYRSCKADKDCPESSTCRDTHGVRLCRVNAI